MVSVRIISIIYSHHCRYYCTEPLAVGGFCQHILA